MLLVARKDDPVGILAKELFPELLWWDEIKEIHAPIVFISRHQSKRENMFTVHFTGDFEKGLSAAAPLEARAVFLNLLGNPFGLPVYLEATHHGPIIDTPCFFAEIGSNQSAWNNEKYVEFLVESVMNVNVKKTEVVCGIGGSHYPEKFTEMEKELAFGHICPKYAQDKLNEHILNEMLEKSGAKRFLVWKSYVKSLGSLKTLLEDYEYELV